MFFIGLHYFIIMTHVSLIKPQSRKKWSLESFEKDKILGSLTVQVYYKKSHEKD